MLLTYNYCLVWPIIKNLVNCASAWASKLFIRLQNVMLALRRKSLSLNIKCLSGFWGNKGTKRKYRGEQRNMTPVLGHTGTQTSQKETFLSIKYIKNRWSRDFIYGHLSTAAITRPQTLVVYKYSLCEYLNWESG